ncbi:MAG: hypothetical protein ABR600_13870 [Actinomycetota bacterium]
MKGNGRTRFRGLARAIVILVTLAGPGLVQAPAQAHDPVELAGALVPPVGFGVSTFAQLPPGDLATSLTFGPGGKLFVTSVQGVAAGDGPQALSNGAVYSFDVVDGVVAGGAPIPVADGFGQVIGMVFGPDGTMYVSDNDTTAYKGSILALRDADGDGTYETRATILKDIPNGRHQTNGMVFGPDGMLYVATGSATDDGTECGPEPASPLACPTQEVQPWTGSILRVNPAWRDVDLLKDVTVDANGYDDPGVLDDDEVLAARGFRNIYDVDTQPGDPCSLYTPMNGSDNPASNEPLYRTNICDQHVVGTDPQGNPIYGPVIDDAGFPSCLYGQHVNAWPQPSGGHEHPEIYDPDDNLNEATIAKFGHCPAAPPRTPIDHILRPVKFLSAHSGTSGLAFERGDDFPERYDGDLFVAEWGSIWNTNAVPPEPSGHKIQQVHFNEDGTVAWTRAFMTGGAPIDVVFGPDGAMYVADFHGSVYRVTFVQDTPDTYTVEIIDGQFVPQVITIPRDVKVLWVNEDTVPHNVTAERAVVVTTEGSVILPGDEINSNGDIPPRKSHSADFEDESGTWVYTSTSSATDTSMQGSVIVAPADR